MTKLLTIFKELEQKKIKFDSLKEKSDRSKKTFQEKHEKKFDKPLEVMALNIMAIEDKFEKTYLAELEEILPGVFDKQGKPINDKKICNLNIKGLQRESTETWRGKDLEIVGVSMKMDTRGVPLIWIKGPAFYKDELVEIQSRVIPVDELCIKVQ